MTIPPEVKTLSVEIDELKFHMSRLEQSCDLAGHFLFDCFYTEMMGCLRDIQEEIDAVARLLNIDFRGW